MAQTSGGFIYDVTIQIQCTLSPTSSFVLLGFPDEVLTRWDFCGPSGIHTLSLGFFSCSSFEFRYKL